VSTGEQGTGKHPHKSTEEPYPHTKDQKGGQRERGEQGGRGGGDREAQAREASGDQGGQSDDLKSREYRDDKGEVHHHTRTYQEQHKGE
jgi:hypothetical protein